MHHEDDADHDGIPNAPGDADLVLRTRSGDGEAFGELWRRHYRSGIVVARSMTSSSDPDDLVQEAYTRIYQAIRKGAGPTGSFRAYLFTSIRNTAASWGRAARETAIDDLDLVEDPATSAQATEDALDRGLTHQAFRSLPSRWQEVLWYTEIEQLKPAEVAPLLGMKPTAVAQLAFRAREGLREAWIQAHLRSLTDGTDCQWTVSRLGAYARGNLSRRDLEKVETHLSDCARCTIVAAEAKNVSRRLALVLLPITVGVGGAGAYLAAIQGGGMPSMAVAALPSSVMAGAVTVAGPAGAGGAGATAGAAGAGGAGVAAGGASVAAGATAAAGAFSGAGAIAGMVAAGALVVGGAVIASVVLPGMVAPPAVVHLAEISPDDGVADAPGSLPTDAAGPLPTVGPSPSDVPASPPTADEEQTDASDAERPIPAQPTTADDSLSDAATGPSTPPMPQPTAAPDADPAPSPDPAPDPEPGSDPDPGPAPETLPDGSPRIASVGVALGVGTAVVTVDLIGQPGARAEALTGGEAVSETVFDEDGNGRVTATVSIRQVLLDRLSIRYIAGDTAGPVVSIGLADFVRR